MLALADRPRSLSPSDVAQVDFNSDEPPMCYMQSHYDELWGLATHPHKQEMATASEDHTLRVWDLGTPAGPQKKTPPPPPVL